MPKPTIGREYQHIEDFLINGGSESVTKVVDHMIRVINDPSLLDFKWDGSASVYWGRDENGEFYFIPKNQWNKGLLLTRDGLYNEILTTGRQRPEQSDEEFRNSREQFGNTLVELWDLLERNTPKDFRGFLNGDLIFTAPLPKSLEVTPNKVKFKFEEWAFGGRIRTASHMIVVHGKFDEFGADTLGNIQPTTDEEISEFNNSGDLIVLNIQHPSVDRLSGIQKDLESLKQFVRRYGKSIDNIANFKTDGFTTLKAKLYSYSVSFSKMREPMNILQWLSKSKLSNNHKNTIKQLARRKEWNKFWAVYAILQTTKLDILSELFRNDDTMKELGIEMTINGHFGGEGFVTEMDNGQIIKLINPEFRYK